jgi:hypothetical protein
VRPSEFQASTFAPAQINWQMSSAPVDKSLLALSSGFYSFMWRNSSALLNSAKVAVIAAMSTMKHEVIWGGRIMGAKMRAETTRQQARKAARAADRAETGVVNSHGRLWRPGPAVPNDRPMPERRLWLAGDRMPPMQDKGELAT